MACPSRLLSLAAALGLLALSAAGPLGPLPSVNVTSSDLGLKEGSCALGDVVYMPGDEFPGAAACERCTCLRGGVQCAPTRCEPRPGCKALHRPDQCCPIYQCECELEGRVYGNGEKLVDPADPCRVCYCQGGEVVCRRIACFVRDDCRPRLVPGRCCPEYDNCPLRGVNTVPGSAPTFASTTAAEETMSSLVSASTSKPIEKIKPEITIKEITPVSEIPVITDVKIKEILPSPGIEGIDYSSSKSPLIVREATSEKIFTINPETSKTEQFSSVTEIKTSPVTFPETPIKSTESVTELKPVKDSPPSKISLSTQDSINNDIYPSVLTSIPTMGSPSITPEAPVLASSTKAPIVEEEDPSMFDHNPAFPPLPDDLSVLANHEDEAAVEPSTDSEHATVVTQEVVNEQAASQSPSTDAVTEVLTTTFRNNPVTTQAPIKLSEIPNTIILNEISTSAPKTTIIDTYSPMLNLRSAIPTEILNVPSFVPEEITGELDDETEILSTTSTTTSILSTLTTENPIKVNEKIDPTPENKLTTDLPKNIKDTKATTAKTIDTTTSKLEELTTYLASSSSYTPQERTTNSIPKTNIATEVTSQTELSSLPIETSDQNPHDVSDTITKDRVSSTTPEPTVEDTTKISTLRDGELITVSKIIPSNTDDEPFENIETTEFILTSFGSSESSTDNVELFKISVDTEKSASIIEPEKKKPNVFVDLMNLVGDVASIGEHTDGPHTTFIAASPTAFTAGISESEELIPVNAGYKSKNNNWNLNSITEVPSKVKVQAPAKQKIVEIEGDDTDTITDSLAPNNKVEPTTRRPIIDNVSDDRPNNKTDKKDIEIITKSYVPIINRRPTKVVMKKNNEKPLTEEVITTEAKPTTTPAVSSPAPSPASTSKPSPASSPETSSVSSPASSSASIPVSSPASITISSPASIPVSSPASIPVSSPASIPVSSPASIRISSPVSIPVSSPASIPVSSPASIPVSSPTSIPVSSPSSITISSSASISVSSPALSPAPPASPADTPAPLVADTTKAAH